MKRNEKHIIIWVIIVIVLILPAMISADAFGQKVKSDAKEGFPMPVNNLYLPGTSFPKRSMVAFARLISLQIDLKDTLNSVLSLPEEPKDGKSNLADIIFSAIRDSTIDVYSLRNESVNPEKLSSRNAVEMLSESTHAIRSDETGNVVEEMILSRDYNGSEVKSYFLRVAELYDAKGNIIGSVPVSVCPCLEIMNGDHTMTFSLKLFDLSFSDRKFTDLLANNRVNFHDSQKPLTYLDFFLKGRYHVDIIESISYSSDMLLSEIGIR